MFDLAIFKQDCGLSYICSVLRPFSQGIDHGNPKVESARLSSFQLGRKTGSVRTPSRESLPNIISATISLAPALLPKTELEAPVEVRH